MVTGVRLGRSPGQIPAGRQGGALVSVLLGRVGAPKDPWRFPVELPQGPLCDAHPASSHLLPPLTIPAQLLFPDFAPEFIKLPGLSYTLPHLICLPHVGVVIPCVLGEHSLLLFFLPRSINTFGTSPLHAFLHTGTFLNTIVQQTTNS